MRRDCRERFPRHRGWAIPTCIMARAWHTCRDAYRNRYPAVFFDVGSGESVPDIPGACATPSFAYLVRGPLQESTMTQVTTACIRQQALTSEGYFEASCQTGEW